MSLMLQRQGGILQKLTQRRILSIRLQILFRCLSPEDPRIVPREDPRIEQATESRAELDIIARTMPYSLQAADSRRSPNSKSSQDLPNAPVLEMSESQPVEPSNIPDKNTFHGGKGGMRGAAERSINDFRYKRYGRSNSRSRVGSPPRNHDENCKLMCLRIFCCIEFDR